jgi:D-aminoacyl-tRNA deacylase
VRLVVQRVRRGAVRTAGAIIGEIDRGAVVLVGVATSDTVETVDRLADKLISLRYFADRNGRTNRSVAEAGGAMLVVSQFTLLADVRRGRRPSFTDAAPPEQAEPLTERFVARLRAAGARVETGRFGASMEVEIVNDGPFTLILDSERDLGPG